jgi:hypothetical protein
MLMMLYVVTVSGFALNLHYCFNRLASVKIDAPASCVKNESGKMKCCKDRHIEIKVKDAHSQPGSPLFFGKFFSLGLPVAVLADFSFSLPNRPTERLLDRGPPRTPVAPIFLKNCTFRI